MVNNDSVNPKHTILDVLRESPEAVSGESLGDRLGMSRVAVYKHIQSLKEQGYRIESGHNGYHIDQNGPMPFSTWEFSDSENIRVLESVGSTMDEAHEQAASHPGENFVIAALKQDQGRGRRDRAWSSAEGGLWATRVVHPSESALHIQRIIMASVVGLARHLREVHKLQAEVKWPNDVVIGGKKIAGILGESRISGDRIVYLALGLGLNVNNPVAIPSATNIAKLIGREADRRGLLRGWIDATNSLMKSEEYRRKGKLTWWTALMVGRRKTITLQLTDGSLTGEVRGVDSLGRLRLRGSDGKNHRLAPGDVESADWNLEAGRRV